MQRRGAGRGSIDDGLDRRARHRRRADLSTRSLLMFFDGFELVGYIYGAFFCGEWYINVRCLSCCSLKELPIMGTALAPTGSVRLQNKNNKVAGSGARRPPNGGGYRMSSTMEQERG